jgi:hypothetical protein
MRRPEDHAPTNSFWKQRHQIAQQHIASEGQPCWPGRQITHLTALQQDRAASEFPTRIRSYVAQ